MLLRPFSTSGGGIIARELLVRVKTSSFEDRSKTFFGKELSVSLFESSLTVLAAERGLKASSWISFIKLEDRSRITQLKIKEIGLPRRCLPRKMSKNTSPNRLDLISFQIQESQLIEP